MTPKWEGEQVCTSEVKIVMAGNLLMRDKTPEGVAKRVTTCTFSSFTPCSLRIVRASLTVAPVSVCEREGGREEGREGGREGGRGGRERRR